MGPTWGPPGADRTLLSGMVISTNTSVERAVLYPDSKLNGANMGPTGPRWAPCWPHESGYECRQPITFPGFSNCDRVQQQCILEYFFSRLAEHSISTKTMILLQRIITFIYCRRYYLMSLLYLCHLVCSWQGTEASYKVIQNQDTCLHIDLWAQTFIYPSSIYRIEIFLSSCFHIHWTIDKYTEYDVLVWSIVLSRRSQVKTIICKFRR